ncbi:cyclin-like protein [Flagelloscypha sp. PMI_526]|nr:cyclin-like protein [Flagelloscypha sp. PMI_526]
MATDFWSSTHYKRWIVDRATVFQARADDLHYVETPEHLDFLAIYFANAITKLCKKLTLRQRVIATAVVFFRRFYLKNSYCDTDPFLVLSACVYVAAKAEESPVHIKNVVTESRSLFAKSDYNHKTFPSDHTKLAEMEFYLVDDLECDLTVFHPYRTLLSLCKKVSASPDADMDDAGVGVAEDDEDGQPRYWGTGKGRLELEEGALQGAWFIINDTYRSDLCLRHPPHLIAIAAIYLILILHGQTRRVVEQWLPSRAKILLNFWQSLNVSIPLVSSIAQEIISMYTLWRRYKEDEAPSSRAAAKSAASSPAPTTPSPTKRQKTPMTPNEVSAEEIVTPKLLSGLLVRMREARISDMSHPANGQPFAVNRILERTKM